MRFLMFFILGVNVSYIYVFQPFSSISIDRIWTQCQHSLVHAYSITIPLSTAINYYANQPTVLTHFKCSQLCLWLTHRAQRVLTLCVSRPWISISTCVIMFEYVHEYMYVCIYVFIQTISIAPLQAHYYSEALPSQHGYCAGISRRSATGNGEWTTCPRSLRGG